MDLAHVPAVELGRPARPMPLVKVEDESGPSLPTYGALPVVDSPPSASWGDCVFLVRPTDFNNRRGPGTPHSGIGVGADPFSDSESDLGRLITSTLETGMTEALASEASRALSFSPISTACSRASSRTPSRLSALRYHVGKVVISKAASPSPRSGSRAHRDGSRDRRSAEPKPAQSLLPLVCLPSLPPRPSSSPPSQSTVPPEGTPPVTGEASPSVGPPEGSPTLSSLTPRRPSAVATGSGGNDGSTSDAGGDPTGSGAPSSSAASSLAALIRLMVNSSSAQGEFRLGASFPADLSSFASASVARKSSPCFLITFVHAVFLFLWSLLMINVRLFLFFL